MFIAVGGGAGYTLYVKDRQLVYEYNFFGKERSRSRPTEPTAGRQGDARVDYTQQAAATSRRGGTGKLFVNGQPAGEGKIEQVAPARFSATETMDIGMDLGAASSLSAQARSRSPARSTRWSPRCSRLRCTRPDGGDCSARRLCSCSTYRKNSPWQWTRNVRQSFQIDIITACMPRLMSGTRRRPPPSPSAFWSTNSRILDHSYKISRIRVRQGA